ncbi:MAG: VOC family protein [Proteobacteria bacterium]|nr:VOC family protein [Pseudomonadota bacterium]
MISRLDHISIAVKDYDKANRFFKELLGAVSGTSAEDPGMQYRWELMSVGDLSRLELIHPTGPNSFLNNFLKDRASGVHHITFETPDIQRTKTHLEKNNIPYFGFREYGNLWKELFIHPRDAFGVLIQIAELKPDDWLDSTVKFPANQKWDIRKKADGLEIDFAHPGGGKMKLNLSMADAEKLLDDLKKCI